MIAFNFHDLKIAKNRGATRQRRHLGATVTDRDFGAICGGRALDFQQGRARISYRGGILISLRGLPKG